MAVDLADFRARFAQFDPISDETVQFAIDDAEVIAARTDRMWLFCAAHIVALEQDSTNEADGGQGEVTEEQIGERRVKYLSMARWGEATDVWLTQTIYGRRVLMMAKTNPSIVMPFFSS